MEISPLLNLLKLETFNELKEREKDLAEFCNSATNLEKFFLGGLQLIYYQKEPYTNEQFSQYVDVILLALKDEHLKLNESKFSNIFINVCKIVLCCIRKKIDVNATFGLIKRVYNILQSQDEFCRMNLDIMKGLYSSVWNLSITKELSLDIAFKLRILAVGFLSFTDANIREVCSCFINVTIWAKNVKLFKTSYADFYYTFMIRLENCLRKKRTSTELDIVTLNQTLLAFANIVKCCETTSMFTHVEKTFLETLKSLLDKTIYKSISNAIELTRLILNIAEDNDEKILKKLEVLNDLERPPVTSFIYCDTLIFGLQEITVKKNFELKFRLYDVILKETSINPSAYLDRLKLVLNELSLDLNQVITIDKRLELIEKFFRPFIPHLKLILPQIQGETFRYLIHNIGINFTNMGAIAYKETSDSLTVECLEFSFLYLRAAYKYISKDYQESIVNIIKKKSGPLKDALRNMGLYEQSVMKALELVLDQYLPPSEIVSSWVKCKRDALKNDDFSLQKMCIQNVCKKFAEEKKVQIDLNVNELLLMELKELRTLNRNTALDELTCASCLVKSSEIRYRLEGYLAQARVVWLDSSLAVGKETASKFIGTGLKSLESYSKEEIYEESLVLEYKTRFHFWSYLCNLQNVQLQTEADLERKLEESKTEPHQSSSLGDEVQPNDECSVRPSTKLASFAAQETLLTDLYLALDALQSLLKGDLPITDKLSTCSDVLSISFAFKLYGILPAFIKALNFLLHIADKYSLKQYWLRGISELMRSFPELISTSLAEKFRSELETEKNRTEDRLFSYFELECLSSLAHYYFRREKYHTGAEIVNTCLSSPLMTKNSCLGLQAQVCVLHVASHFAHLPSVFLDGGRKPVKSSLALASLSSRKSIFLLPASANSVNENIAWNHNVAWHHHVSNMWLGHLCLLAGQPRRGRSYLIQALTIAEKFAMPLRISEALCKLAEIDLQCEQFADCRVKMCSLDEIFNVHSPAYEHCQNLLKTSCKDSNSTLIYEKSGTENEPKSAKKSLRIPRKVTFGADIRVFADNTEADMCKEKLREVSTSHSFSLIPPPVELGNQVIVIGKKNRIKEPACLQMISSKDVPTSPTFRNLDENFAVRSVFSSCSNVVKCNVCLSPELHILSLKANVIMAVIHAHMGNFKGSKKCFQQTTDILDNLTATSSDVCSKIVSILGSFNFTAEDVGGFAQIPNLSTGFRPSSSDFSNYLTLLISQAKLMLMYNQNETLCMYSENWPKMRERVDYTLKQVAAMNSHVLASNHSEVLQIILQGRAIKKTLIVRKQIEERESAVSTEDCEMVGASDVCSPELFSSPSFKTPSRPSIKTKPLQKQASTPFPSTPFSIHCDDEPSNLPNSVRPLKSVRTYEKSKLQKVKFDFDKLALNDDAGSPDDVEIIKSPDGTSVKNSSKKSSKLKMTKRQRTGGQSENVQESSGSMTTSQNGTSEVVQLNGSAEPPKELVETKSTRKSKTKSLTTSSKASTVSTTNSGPRVRSSTRMNTRSASSTSGRKETRSMRNLSRI